MMDVIIKNLAMYFYFTSLVIHFHCVIQKYQLVDSLGITAIEAGTLWPISVCSTVKTTITQCRALLTVLLYLLIY